MCNKRLVEQNHYLGPGLLPLFTLAGKIFRPELRVIVLVIYPKN